MKPVGEAADRLLLVRNFSGTVVEGFKGKICNYLLLDIDNRMILVVVFIYFL